MRATGHDAAMAALSGRVAVREPAGRTAEPVIEELYSAVFGAKPAPDGEQGQPGGARPGEA